MKKQIVLSIVFIFFFLAVSIPQAPAGEAARDIPVVMDGLPVDFDVKPVIREGRTLVPFRKLAELLNVPVTWDSGSRTVKAEKGGITLSMTIDGPTAYLNGRPVALDAPPVLLGGRTLIPARIFSEAFGCRVIWDDAGSTVKITSPPGQMKVTGFYALGDSGTSSWTDLFGQPYPGTGAGHTGAVSTLALGWYSLDRLGNLTTRSSTGWERPESWEDVLKAAAKHRLKTEMVIHLTDGDGSITSLLTNQQAMQRAVGGIVKEAGLYQGVNLDFEGLGWGEEGPRLTATRDSFTGFVRLLSKQLKAVGLGLSVTLHPPNSAYPGYDYQALGGLADRLIVMAYDYGPKPEPVELVIQALEAAKSSVPPEKLFLGISAPSETPESILAKVGLAKRYNLGGIGLWRLGLISDGMWNLLESSVQAVK